MVYGYGGRFADETTVADLDEALASIPEQLERGFTTICIKPSQFIDDPSEMRSVPRPSRGARFTWRTLATRGRVREPRYCLAAEPSTLESYRRDSRIESAPATIRIAASTITLVGSSGRPSHAS